ncbi:MAG: hypothetical protein KIT57_21115 [Blastocatellales bacterium]|nr:hypothetical protein [Blastocatellales bacterium]
MMRIPAGVYLLKIEQKCTGRMRVRQIRAKEPAGNSPDFASCEPPALQRPG